jgi:molybdenum cofactor cytidylyltransferase
MIAAILLAAGESRISNSGRLGRGAIVAQTLENYLASMADECILVLGYEADRLREAIRLPQAERGKTVRMVVNPDYRQGLLSSIQCGLRVLSDECRAFLIALGDQPLIKAEVINRVIQAYLEGGFGIVVPVYRGLRGHPVLFDVKYKSELLELRGQRARRILERHSQDVLEVEIHTASVISDIDGEGDYLLQWRRFSILETGGWALL